MYSLKALFQRSSGFYAREEMWAPVVIGTVATAVAFPIYWLLQARMGVNGLALASSIAMTLYTIALGVEWYRRTGWEHLSPVVITGAKAVVPAALGGWAAWARARALLDSPAFWLDAAVVALGGLIVLAVVLGPPWVRCDLRTGERRGTSD